ncbi:MAG: glutamate racemase [Ignavibacteria bacterium]|nr:glutamate racemase [Ignavibacteria bacterium]
MDTKEKKIAFFDSGIGGLTVLRDAGILLPTENYIYFADTVNVPYGTKSNEQVFGFISEAVEYLSKKSIKVLVVACNTATSLAIKELRAKYEFPIIGMEPAVKPAIINSGSKRILVTATTLTLKEEKLENLLNEIDTDNKTDKLSLDELVKFAEKFDFKGEKPENYIKSKFAEYDFNDYEAIVLGCTHFLYFKDLIYKSAGKNGIKIIDGNEGTVNRLNFILKENNLASAYGNGSVEFINSCTPETDKFRLGMFSDILKGKI